MATAGMQIQQQMEQSFAMQLNTGMTQEGESDEIKRIFLEGNAYLLALTMAGSGRLGVSLELLLCIQCSLADKLAPLYWKSGRWCM